FSSRRRHTRSKRDWSSDVCSSDLILIKWIEAFLGPAVVALAYPLYQNRNVLKQLLLPILLGTFTGALTGIVSGVLMTKGLGFNRSEERSVGRELWYGVELES